MDINNNQDIDMIIDEDEEETQNFEDTEYILNYNTFSRRYKCHSMIFYNSDDKFMETNDKILMPLSTLDILSRLNIDYPLTFELFRFGFEENKTYCGVLEFIPDTNIVYLPQKIMDKLFIGEGENLQIRYVKMQKIKFIKLKPMSCDFLKIMEPKVILEETLKNYTCISNGDILDIVVQSIEGEKIEVLVTEVLPDGKGMTIDCECEVDFEEPVGYQEHLEQMRLEQEAIMKKIENETSKALKEIPRTLQKGTIDKKDEVKPSIFQFLNKNNNESNNLNRKSLIDTNKFSTTKNFAAFSGKGNSMLNK
jgi:hypothetical protein